MLSILGRCVCIAINMVSDVSVAISAIVTALSVMHTPTYPHVCSTSLYICKKTCFHPDS